MFARRNVDGEGIMPGELPKETPEELENFRDLLAATLEERKYSQRAIARVLGLTQGAVSKRLARVPDHVRERVRAEPLGQA